MRITMFVYNTFEQDARVLREAASLAARGHEVEVVALLGNRTPERESLDGVAVTRVDADPVVSKVARWALGLWRALRGTGRGRRPAPVEIGAVGATLVSRPGGFGSYALRAHLWATHRRFRRRALALARARPAAIWVAHDLDTLEIGNGAKQRLGGRLVYDCHELWLERSFVPPLSRRARRRWTNLEQRLVHAADRVTTVSELMADELARRHGIERPVVIRNLPASAEGDQAAPADLREWADVPRGRRIALYLGGLSPDRGIEQLIEAAATLPELAVVLVGSGDLAYVESLRRRSERVGIEDRVRMPGAVTPAAVVARARGADLGLVANLHPGLNHRYTVPNRLYTYLAAGVPVVGSRTLAFEPLIRSNEVGTTCDVTDPAELARAVEWLLEDGDRHERMRRNALEFSRRESWERESERLVGLFEGLG